MSYGQGPWAGVAYAGALPAVKTIVSYLFTPPTLADTPPYLPGSDPVQVGLWRHMKNRVRGVNVFILNDGAVVQTTPTPQTPTPTPEAMKNVAVPYPWNPYAPTAPYVELTNWTGSTSSVTLTPRIRTVFFGGHENEVTLEDAAILTAAGYAKYLTPVYGDA